MTQVQVREEPDCGVELWTVEAAERMMIHTDVVILKKYFSINVISMVTVRIERGWGLERCSALV